MLRRVLLSVSASLLVAAVPAVAIPTASAVAKPAAHAARHHKKKKHKKHHRKHKRHHHTTPTTNAPTPTVAPGPAPTNTPGPVTTPQPVNTPAAPTIPLGSYNCYKTVQVLTNPGAGFYSSFAKEIDLHSDGSYFIPLATIGTDNLWNQQGNTINFTNGPLWSDINHAHDQGTWFPDGVSMPNAASNVASGGYTLVIRDTVQEGGVPPSVEYSTTDGSGGSSSQPESFFYCKLP